MAIGATAVWEVRESSGSNTNGGFYTSGGTDYSQQDSAQLSVSDAVTNTTTTITSATGGFTAAMVGNGLYLSGDAEWYEIATYVSGNEITVDRATNDTGGGKTLNVGGALGGSSDGSGLQIAADQMVDGNIIYVKDNFQVTAAIDFDKAEVGNAGRRIVGYSGTRSQDITSNTDFVTVTKTGAVDDIFYISQNRYYFSNFAFDGADRHNINDVAGLNTWVNLKSENAGSMNFNLHTSSRAFYLYSNNSGDDGIDLGNDSHLYYSFIKDANGDAITANGDCSVVGNVVKQGTGNGNGINVTGGAVFIFGNTVDGTNTSSKTGIDFTQHSTIAVNNIISNWNIGIDADADELSWYGYNNIYNCTTDVQSQTPGVIDLGGNIDVDPQYTNLAGDDLSVGTNVKAKGPFDGSAFLGSASIPYIDIGAVQRAESATNVTISGNTTISGNATIG